MLLDHDTINWLALGVSLLLLAAYELLIWRHASRHPLSLARSAHARLRALWVHVMGREAGSEIIAVQTLRNSLMSATITASTAMLGLMGTVTLIAPALLTGAEHGLAWGPHLMCQLLLMLALFASYVASAMAVRYYNHTGFIVTLPPGSEERSRMQPVAEHYIKRAGILYGWGLRFFFYAAPLAAGLVKPLALPAFTVALLGVLVIFDRPGSGAPGMSK